MTSIHSAKKITSRTQKLNQDDEAFLACIDDDHAMFSFFGFINLDILLDHSIYAIKKIRECFENEAFKKWVKKNKKGKYTVSEEFSIRFVGLLCDSTETIRLLGCYTYSKQTPQKEAEHMIDILVTMSCSQLEGIFVKYRDLDFDSGFVKAARRSGRRLANHRTKASLTRKPFKAEIM